MPAAWRVRVIEDRLGRDGIRATVTECDVYSLSAERRRTVTDVLVAERTTFPMVLVGDTVVCHGGLDLDAVARRALEGLADVGCCC